MSMSASRARPVLSRVLVGFVVAVATTAVGPAVGWGATSPVHVKLTFGPVVFDVPAGVVCDFAYHEEDTGTQNVKRFFDDEGHLVRVVDQIAITLLHRNADTGTTLIEHLDAVAHVDFVTGQEDLTGETWHLFDEEGHLVLGRGGLIVIDLATGDVIDQTPQALSGNATLCAALGGSLPA